MAGDQGAGRGRSADTGARGHRWAVDRIEEGTAAVEQDGDHVYEIPRYLLPTDARDGDVLSVTVGPAAGGEVTISVRIDRAATANKGSAKLARLKRRPDKDPGGDIVL